MDCSFQSICVVLVAISLYAIGGWYGHSAFSKAVTHSHTFQQAGKVRVGAAASLPACGS